MLSLKMNDSAVTLLNATAGLAGLGVAGDMTPALHERLARGIARRGAVLTWADSAGNAAAAPSIFHDLTAWECADTSFHLEDFVPITMRTVEDAPVITDADQQSLLQHGIAFALGFSRLVYDLNPRTAVRCILGANQTNATFRFHQIRPGESWSRPNLDDYRLEHLIVIEIEPVDR